MDWKKLEVSSVGQFLSASEDEVITIIKTGFNNNYIVVFDSAHDDEAVSSTRLTSEEIFKEFNIVVDE